MFNLLVQICGFQHYHQLLQSCFLGSGVHYQITPDGPAGEVPSMGSWRLRLLVPLGPSNIPTQLMRPCAAFRAREWEKTRTRVVYFSVPRASAQRCTSWSGAPPPASCLSTMGGPSPKKVWPLLVPECCPTGVVRQERGFCACSVLKSPPKIPHTGSVQFFNQCGLMLAMFATVVFVLLPAAILWKGAGFPAMHRCTRVLTCGWASSSCCGLLASTIHLCFDLFGPMQPQYKLPPAGSQATGLLRPHRLFTVALGLSHLLQPLLC